MSELKTRPNSASIEEFLNSVADEKRRADSFEILQIMKELTGQEPVMWGGSIIGFGEYKYTYSNKKEESWLATGFSPRKKALTIYIMLGFDKYQNLMDKLGKYKTGKSCLYLKSLSDVDLTVLKELIAVSYKHITNNGGVKE